MMKMMKKTVHVVVAGGLALGCMNAAEGAISSLQPDDSLDGFTTSTSPALNPANGAGTEEGQWGLNTTSIQATVGGASTDPNDDTSNLTDQVWVSRNEDAPQLTTTLSGLDSSKPYFIYLYHVSRTGDFGNTYGIFAHIDGVTTSQFYGFEDAFEVEEIGANQGLERVLLGTVSGVSSIDIIVNDDDNSGLNASRSFYKGVGVELVPEPASIALLGLGGLMILRRRR